MVSVSSFQTLTVTIAYFISVYILWTPERAPIFRKTSLLLWLVVTGFVAGLTGSFQVYTFMVLQVLGVTGFAIEVVDVHKKLLEIG